MAEKCTVLMPSIRITESLERALQRLAMRDERSFSEYVRKTLERHAFGHACSLEADDENQSDFGALQRSADELGGARR